MGCFNKIGFYSNLPILGGEDIVIFICLKPIKGKFNSTAPLYIDEYLQPLCLPIFCEYDEYGSGEQIKEDFNTELIKEKIGVDINTLISMINTDDGVYYDEDSEDKHIRKINKFLKENKLTDYALTMTMERKDVYDKMVQISNVPFFDIDNYDEGARIGDFWLKQLGFKLDKDAQSKFKKTYRLNKNDRCYVESSGTAPSIFNNNGEETVSYRGIKDFINKWEKNTGMILKYNKDIEKLNQIDISFKCSGKIFKKTQKEKEKINRLLSQTEQQQFAELLKWDSYSQDEETLFNIIFNIRDNDMPNDILFIGYCSRFNVPHSMVLYRGINIFQSNYKQTICDFIKFNRTLSDVCGYYRPSSYGHQQVGYKPFIHKFDEINECFSSIIKNIIEKYDEEDDD